jgi:transposase
LSQLHGVSGMRIVEAILAGERDPQRLARLCHPQVLKAKESELVASLEGNWQKHHLFALRQGYENYQFYQGQIAACDKEIEATLRECTVEMPPQERVAGRKVKITRHNAPQIEDLYGKLLTMCGGKDIQLLPGLGPLSWLKLVGELGTDLSRWATPKHFTGYLGLSPAHHQSGKRKRRVGRRKTRAGQIFREAVLSLQKSKNCALGEFYRRIKGRRGAPVAIVATARKLAELYWRVMIHGVEYVEHGLAEYRKRQQEQTERYLRRKAAQLGFTLQPATPPAMT